MHSSHYKRLAVVLGVDGQVLMDAAKLIMLSSSLNHELAFEHILNTFPTLTCHHSKEGPLLSLEGLVVVVLGIDG